MEETSKDPVNFAPLWDIVRKELLGKANDEWELISSTNPNISYFIQGGLHGATMKCYFLPRTIDEEGDAQVILKLSPNEFKIVQHYAETHPDSLIIPPLNFRLNLQDYEDQKFGLIYTTARISSQTGPDLFSRLGPWYPASLVAIWNLIIKAAKWHQSQNDNNREQT
jgi:hypothetical protein